MRETLCPCCHGRGKLIGGGVDADPDLSLATLYTLDPMLRGRLELDSETGCWIWQGATQRSGSKGNAVYGRLRRRGVLWLVHRWVYTLMVGRIPDGHHVHHRVEGDCVSTLCCNPQHLEDIEEAAHEWLHRELAGYDDHAAV